MASLDILYFNPLNLKNKITKIEHKKIFCGSSNILKSILRSISICLKYFLIPSCPQKLSITLPFRSYILSIWRGVCHHATSPTGTLIIYFRRVLAVIHSVYKMYLIDVSSSDVPLFQTLKLFLLQLQV